MKYRFIEREQGQYSVKQLCENAGIGRSSYYAWKKRKTSARDEKNVELMGLIQLIYKHSRKTYGYPRVYAQLRKDGEKCNKKRVARLMRVAELQGQRKSRKVYTTDSKHDYPVAENLLNREFEAQKPNEKWVADITYIPTDEGWLYLAGVLDLYSRRIVGWDMSGKIDAKLVERALRMALYQRQPDRGLLHHSDRGSQYASHSIQNILAANHIQVSMSGKADCYDNAVMESFFSTLKNEWVHHQRYRSRSQARTDIFDYIEGFYNTVRLHSTLRYLSPAEYEAQYWQTP
jgi:transposase InsO family protein